jgi:hypothetical protein
VEALAIDREFSLELTDEVMLLLIMGRVRTMRDAASIAIISNMLVMEVV